MSITSGEDDVWSSRDCPRAIPAGGRGPQGGHDQHRRDVERASAPTRPARGSPTWAMPGWYHVTAAALGGEPSDLQFELTAPTPATITQTVSPAEPAAGDRAAVGHSRRAQPTRRAD